MKKVKVVNDKCIGCGACIAIDPEHFDFDNEKGLSKVISEKNIESPKVEEAADACPVGAIEIFEGCNNENCLCNPCECGDNCECEIKEETSASFQEEQPATAKMSDEVTESSNVAETPTDFQ